VLLWQTIVLVIHEEILETRADRTIYLRGGKVEKRTRLLPLHFVQGRNDISTLSPEEAKKIKEHLKNVNIFLDQKQKI